ncbi:MAG: hypothetical protein AB7J40_00005, partial [Candidatus Altimarinota bacterium]
MSLDRSKIDLCDPRMRDLKERKESELFRAIDDISVSNDVLKVIQKISKELVVEVVGEYLQKSQMGKAIDDADLARYYREQLIEKCQLEAEVGQLMPIIRGYVLGVIAWLDQLASAKVEKEPEGIDRLLLDQAKEEQNSNVGVSSLVIKLGRARIQTNEQLRTFYERVAKLSQEEGKKALKERYRKRSNELGWNDSFSYPEGGLRSEVFKLLKGYLENFFPGVCFQEV